MRTSLRSPLLASLFALACGAPHGAPATRPPTASLAPSPQASVSVTSDEPVPGGRLPADVRPARYRLSLTVLPASPTFEGIVEIDAVFDRPRSVVWLHGKGLRAQSVTLAAEGQAPISAKWEPESDDGVVALRLAKPMPAGKVRIRIAFEAPFLAHEQGLYVVKAGSTSYAFTQFEEISARQAFPCFDEPAFKTPFEISLTVPADHRAVANTREVRDEALPNGLHRLDFAPTAPIPSYLVAFAVGPFDVVEAAPIPANALRQRPVPLRGIAVKGRGKELRYALDRTGAILSILEAQVGRPYPYEKLDVIAVPEKGGAMENPGAVTFAESLLLVDAATAPVSQRRAFAGVMAHELAHQWFGNEVTMVWWDDIWLNEAFASWMGPRATQLFQPDLEAENHHFERVAGAMGSDALTTARSVRQPIRSSHDIRNAFDDITYQKGAGVIGMFERWIGRPAFRDGVRAYLAAHSMGNATADDLLKALSAAAGKEVGPAFRTFLDQPGVPFVEVKVVCDASPHLGLTQSRYLPLGSGGDAAKIWQVPVCARYQVGGTTKEACTLLAERTGSLPLAGCPDWVLPNADGAGYYRYQMPPEDTATVMRRGFDKLSVREKMSLAGSLRAGFGRGTAPGGAVMKALAPFAEDAHPLVADEPMSMVDTARDWLFATEHRGRVEDYARSLYRARAKALAWDASKRPTAPEAAVLKQRVLTFLAQTGRDPAVRREASKRGRAYLGLGGDGRLHPEAVDPELSGLALAVAVEDGDAGTFEAVLGRLGSTEDEVLRGRLVAALGAARDPSLAARARALVLDPRVRDGEALGPLWPQLADPRTRDEAWTWAKTHLDAIITKVSPARSAYLPYLAGSFCEEARAKELEALFATRIEGINGGPRVLAAVAEGIRLCANKKAAQEPSMRSFFAGSR